MLGGSEYYGEKHKSGKRMSRDRGVYIAGFRKDLVEKLTFEHCCGGGNQPVIWGKSGPEREESKGERQEQECCVRSKGEGGRERTCET